MRRVNELCESGLLRQWATGGAFAFMYYSQPVLSYDIDVFCMIPFQGLLVSLTSIEGSPIQFLDVAPYEEKIAIALRLRSLAPSW